MVDITIIMVGWLVGGGQLVVGAVTFMVGWSLSWKLKSLRKEFKKEDEARKVFLEVSKWHPLLL